MRIKLLILFILTSTTSYSGELFNTLDGACKLNGTNHFVLYVPSNLNTNCTQACSNVKCENKASCVRGWTLWYDKFYAYGSECSNNNDGIKFKPNGRICCCEGIKCDVPIQEYKY